MKNNNNISIGDVVVMVYGSKNKSGIIISTDKRKSRVRFIDGLEMFVSNKKIKIIHDVTLKNRILRELEM